MKVFFQSNDPKLEMLFLTNSNSHWHYYKKHAKFYVYIVISYTNLRSITTIKLATVASTKLNQYLYVTTMKYSYILICLNISLLSL